MPRKLRLGKSAIVNVLVSRVHPSKDVKEKYINPVNNQRLNGCVVLREEVKRVTGREQKCVVFIHEDFGGKELHAVKRWINVDVEGPSHLVFEEVVAAPVVPPTGDAVGEDLPDLDAVPEEMLAEFEEEQVDDDNAPAPENVPNAFPTQPCPYEGWGHDGTCNRRKTSSVNFNARLRIKGEREASLLAIFETLFFVDFVKRVILPTMNKSLTIPITYGEFLQWVGTTLLMATTFFENKRDFWSETVVDKFKGAPFRFSPTEGEMSGNRYRDISSALEFTDKTPPIYQDRFWEVRDMLDEFNMNMGECFTPSHKTCLDESMSKSLNPFTTPGFMVVPRKPWPFGNEYHTICCAISGILFALELVEGKDTPPQRPAKEFSHLGKTVGLLLRLTKSIWGTSRIVILDSGFCVLEGLKALRQKGVFASALIKKRRYWPKYVDGDGIATHFATKDVGVAEAVRGHLEDVPFHIYALKEPDYVLSMMSTYGTLEGMGRNNVRRHCGRKYEFQYPEVLHNHYQYRDAVDNHNKLRMYPIAIEESNKTTRWAMRVFNFLIAVTEVNTRLAWTKLYENEHMSQVEFRRQLANVLIHNIYLDKKEETRRITPRKRMKYDEHVVQTTPAGHSWKQGILRKCGTKYLQLKCVGCARRVRTYCLCSPGVIRCDGCWQEHVKEVFSTC